MSRLPKILTLSVFVFGTLTGLLAEEKQSRPNIILCMADDQGWGDTGYNGHPYLKTPNLDQMSREGVTFNRFYSAAAMCSPTRGSVYTGRNPYRFGITFAMKGMLEESEIAITSVVKKAGYTTSHFGKWHLGTLSKEMGRLRSELDSLGVADNTMLWYCSDNGPARQGSPRHVGSAKHLSGYKLSIAEGGIRVPGLMVWPDRIKKPVTIDTPCVTSDYFPTILSTLGIDLASDRIYDGLNLWPIIEGGKRDKPIGFLNKDAKESVWMEERYKFTSTKKGEFLFDIIKDPAEKRNLFEKNAKIASKMSSELSAWKAGVLKELIEVQ